MKKICLIGACLFLISCQIAKSDDPKLSADKTVLQSICNNKAKTVVFLWTSWCGAGQEIIEKTYKPLMDSIQKGHLKMNIIMLCGNSNNDVRVQSFNLDSNFRSFYIADPGNGIAFNDRRHIRNFIKTSFTKGSDVFMKEINQFSFGVPITFLVNNKLEIIMEHAPQDIDNLIYYGQLD